MVDWIPFVSQFKSLFQWIGGDAEGAKRTQENFSKQMPVVSQIRSIVESASGDNEAARQTQMSFANNLSDVADAVPVIGHIKGGIHHAAGDHEGGDRALLSATRTAVVVGTGIATGGAGAVGAGLAYDGLTTAITGQNQGFIAAVDNAANNPSAGNIFDAAMVPVGDSIGGVAGKKWASKTPSKQVPVVPQESIPLLPRGPSRPSTSSSSSSIASGITTETIRHRPVPARQHQVPAIQPFYPTPPNIPTRNPIPSRTTVPAVPSMPPRTTVPAHYPMPPRTTVPARPLIPARTTIPATRTSIPAIRTTVPARSTIPARNIMTMPTFKVKITVRDVFSGGSSKFHQLMYPLSISPYVKHFGPSDKFYEMPIFRYVYDNVQVRVVRIEEPPPVPVRLIGEMDPDDEMENGFMADDYGDILEYYSLEEKAEILEQYAAQAALRRTVTARYTGTSFTTGDEFQRYAQQPNRRPDGRLRAIDDYTLHMFLHVPMPAIFNYTGAILVNSETQGLLHSFFRHHSQWRDRIQGLDMNPFRAIMHHLNAVEAVQHDDRLAVIRTNELIARLGTLPADDQIEISRNFNYIQAALHRFIVANTTHANYMGENVNNNGYVQVYFLIPGSRQVMVVCVSKQLYARMRGSGDLPVRTITTIFFNDEDRATRRITGLPRAFPRRS